MPIKITQLTELTTINGTTVIPVIDVAGAPISKKATVTNIAAQILSGNAATATKLQTAVNINGVSFDGTADISITAPLATATTSILGGVIVGSGITVGVDGTISTIPAAAKLFHGFSVDANGNLIYSTTADSTIILQDQYGTDIYEDTDIGSNDYSYSMDAGGNLIVTYS
jgi:hypothetical protein